METKRINQERKTMVAVPDLAVDQDTSVAAAQPPVAEVEVVAVAADVEGEAGVVEDVEVDK